MHTIQMAMPDSRLTSFVRCFAQREISAQASSLAQTGLAQLEHTLAFYLQGQPTMHYWSGTTAVLPRIHFVGAHTRSPGCAHFTGSVSAFGIFLKPFASWKLFRIPPAQFAGQEFQAQEVFGPWITELWLKLAECETFCERIQVATETLLPFAEHASPPTRTMAAAQNLFQTNFGTRIQQLAHESCMSVRTYERKFLGEMGISPKLFARLRRFQMALDRKRALGNRWLDVAHDLGYFDQMHMVKEFRAFGGEAPSTLVENCGDHQPWSIGVPLSLNHVTTNEFPNRLIS
jgi:AraC-like DNA-binding protein